MKHSLENAPEFGIIMYVKTGTGFTCAQMETAPEAGVGDEPESDLFWFSPSGAFPSGGE